MNVTPCPSWTRAGGTRSPYAVIAGSTLSLGLWFRRVKWL
jgi:hypothetical protein